VGRREAGSKGVPGDARDQERARVSGERGLLVDPRCVERDDAPRPTR